MQSFFGGGGTHECISIYESGSASCCLLSPLGRKSICFYFLACVQLLCFWTRQLVTTFQHLLLVIFFINPLRPPDGQVHLGRRPACHSGTRPRPRCVLRRAHILDAWAARGDVVCSLAPPPRLPAQRDRRPLATRVSWPEVCVWVCVCMRACVCAALVVAEAVCFHVLVCVRVWL